MCLLMCVVNNELERQTAKCNATCDALLAAMREIKRDNVAYAQRQRFICACVCVCMCASVCVCAR